MMQCVARVRGTAQWRPVTLVNQAFACDEGLMLLLLEKIGEKYPHIEYEARTVHIPPNPFDEQFSAHFQ